MSLLNHFPLVLTGSTARILDIVFLCLVVLYFKYEQFVGYHCSLYLRINLLLPNFMAGTCTPPMFQFLVLSLQLTSTLLTVKITSQQW